MGFTLIGGGGGGTVNVPTPLTYTFAQDGNNFNLLNSVTVQNGTSLDTLTASPVAITGSGGLSAALDGLEIDVQNIGRPGRIVLYADGVQIGVGVFNNASYATVRFFQAIASGKALTVAIATNSAAAQSFIVSARGFQTSPHMTSTSTSTLSGTSNVSASQGIKITNGSPSTWLPIGTLSADAQGLGQVTVNTGGDGSRTNGTEIVDIGIGNSGSSTPDRILVAGIVSNCSSNAVQMRDPGPYFLTGMTSGKILYARAKRPAGDLPDDVSVQVTVINGTAL